MIKKYATLVYALFCCSLASITPVCSQAQRALSINYSKDSVQKILKKVADWQLNDINVNGWKHPDRHWANGAMYTGYLAYANLTKDNTYLEFMRQVGVRNNWKLLEGERRYHADDYIVGQIYCKMYELYKDPAMIADLRALADTLIARPHTTSLKYLTSTKFNEWNWCDALFMGPPTLSMLAKVTGEKKYLDINNKLWWQTTDYLYDKESSLFFRDNRYFEKREKNGEKVFWARGNGWVIAGLAQVLEMMPRNYPERKRYVSLFKELAVKIASLQKEDGSWRASLLDSETYSTPETSGTGFFCYALAWGVNNGLLEKKTYSPIVLKAWNAMVNCVSNEGKLGYVQPIGASPGKAGADQTEVYGTGAFLLSGTEIYKMAKK